MNRDESIIDALRENAKEVAMWVHFLAGDEDGGRKVRRGAPRWSDRGEVTLKRSMGYVRYRRRYNRKRFGEA